MLEKQLTQTKACLLALPLPQSEQRCKWPLELVQIETAVAEDEIVSSSDLFLHLQALLANLRMCGVDTKACYQELKEIFYK